MLRRRREIQVACAEPRIATLEGSNGWRKNAVDTLGALRFVVFRLSS